MSKKYKTKHKTKHKTKSKKHKTKSKTKKQNKLGLGIDKIPKVLLKDIIGHLESEEIPGFLNTAHKYNQLKDEPEIKKRLDKQRLLNEVIDYGKAEMLHVPLSDLIRILKNIINNLADNHINLVADEIDYEESPSGSFKEIVKKKNLNEQDIQKAARLVNQINNVNIDLALLESQNLTREILNTISLKYLEDLNNIQAYEDYLEDFDDEPVFFIFVMAPTIGTNWLVYYHDGADIKEIDFMTVDEVDDFVTNLG